MILLFGNAFGAYATAYALTGGALPIITIQIGAQIRGDVLHNPGLGYAMALGMVVHHGGLAGGLLLAAGTDGEVAAMITPASTARPPEERPQVARP